MKKLLFLLLLIPYLISAQTEDAWVYFNDKPNASSYLANPLDMLSQRAIDRRIQQGIALDEKDVPLYPSYVTQIAESTGITIVAKSKWLNSVHVQGTEDDINALTNLDFVLSIEFANNSLNNRLTIDTSLINSHQDKLETLTDFNYGQASNQIEMLGGDFLHQNNFTGEGMQIAVIDAGFTNVDTMGAFDRIRTNNQILGTYNFVDRNENVYGLHYHGTMVLSTMAGYVEDEFVGTAPDASYYLFISEDVTQEHPIEESLWVEAAEKADSLGVDVINTSLGYTTFDRPEYDHTYEQLNGATTYISRGAGIAFTRGILVINAAGNSGSSSWHYIGAPADAHDILSIGAVNADETMAGFSSYGPTSDGIIKPDVCAQGGSATVINTSNTIISSNGTSFASPILCGVAACFWQAFPDKTNIQIAQTIRESAHLYNAPEDQYGYGIPDFEAAYGVLITEENVVPNINIFPNPLEKEGILFIKIPTEENIKSLTIIDLPGKTIYYKQGNDLPHFINFPKVKSGLYVMQISTDSTDVIKKIIVK